MTTVTTLREQKAAEADRRRCAVVALKVDLAAYARAHDGRFLLFGSAARGEMRYNSDVDLLAEFSRADIDDAWVFAEDACRRHGLTPDIRPKSWCGPAFLDHVQADVEVIA
jgi:hypothetical protein